MEQKVPARWTVTVRSLPDFPQSRPPSQPQPDMSSLQTLCSGLPLRPLPENRGRWAGVSHAPVRTPGLSPLEEQVRSRSPFPPGLLPSGAVWMVRMDTSYFCCLCGSCSFSTQPPIPAGQSLLRGGRRPLHPPLSSFSPQLPVIDGDPVAQGHPARSRVGHCGCLQSEE